MFGVELEVSGDVCDEERTGYYIRGDLGNPWHAPSSG